MAANEHEYDYIYLCLFVSIFGYLYHLFSFHFPISKLFVALYPLARTFNRFQSVSYVEKGSPL